MSKILMTTMIAIALAGVALTAMPTTSALTCGAIEPGNEVTQYVARTCTYCVFGSGGLISNPDAGDFIECAEP
jgi:hypothetical protein